MVQHRKKIKWTIVAIHIELMFIQASSNMECGSCKTRAHQSVQHKVSRLFYRVLSLLCIAICFGYIPFHSISFRFVPFRSVRLQFISTTFLDHTKWKRFCLTISFFVCASSFPSTLLEQTWVRCCGCETKLRLKKYISCQIKRKQSTHKNRTFSQWPQKYIN